MQCEDYNDAPIKCKQVIEDGLRKCTWDFTSETCRELESLALKERVTSQKGGDFNPKIDRPYSRLPESDKAINHGTRKKMPEIKINKFEEVTFAKGFNYYPPIGEVDLCPEDSGKTNCENIVKDDGTRQCYYDFSLKKCRVLQEEYKTSATLMNLDAKTAPVAKEKKLGKTKRVPSEHLVKQVQKYVEEFQKAKTAEGKLAAVDKLLENTDKIISEFVIIMSLGATEEEQDDFVKYSDINTHYNDIANILQNLIDCKTAAHVAPLAGYSSSEDEDEADTSYIVSGWVTRGKYYIKTMDKTIQIRKDILEEDYMTEVKKLLGYSHKNQLLAKYMSPAMLGGLHDAIEENRAYRKPKPDCKTARKPKVDVKNIITGRRRKN